MIVDTITPPLKWHGGKRYVAPEVLRRMPPHLHYVEPFFGGGQVLFARDPDDERLFWPGKTSDGRRARGVSEVIGVPGHDGRAGRLGVDQLVEDARLDAALGLRGGTGVLR